MTWLCLLCERIRIILLVLLLEPASSDVCTTQICQQAAAHVLNTIDASVDPCDNFYKFACGGLFKNTLRGKPASLIALVEDEVDRQIKTMLEEPVEPSDPKAIQSLKKFYSSCMDEASIEKEGLNSIKGFLDQLGGWPVVTGSKWNGSGFKFEDLIIKLRQLGLDCSQLFYFSISASEPDKIWVSVPISSLIKRKNKSKFHHFITNIAVLLGADQQRASTELKEIIQFETKLYRIAHKKLKSYKITFKGAQENYPFLNWLKFINAIYSNHMFSEDDHAYLPPKKYLTELEKLLKETLNRTVANYIIWKALEGAIPYLPKAFRDLKINYDASISKRFAEEEKHRFNVCKWASLMILPPALETLYIKKYFPLERKNKIERIVSVIMNEFINLLNNTDLYDEVSRNRALQKVNSITYLVGGPDELFHEERLAEVFDNDENIDSTDCLTLASVLNRQRYNYELKFNTTLNDIYSLYVAVNAYYNSYTKSLVIPAATMQGLYFNEERPQYMNFGTLGMLVGHELTHAFAKNANDVDKAWTKFTANKFQAKAKCITEQISNFDIEGSKLHMDGIKVLEETVCDFNGAEVAYRSYQNWIKTHGEEKQLPDLNYTPNQLFWISSANFFCDTVAPDQLQELIDNDPHAHPEFRIFGTMSNNGHFAKDFNCPAGSKMHRSRKCRIF